MKREKGKARRIINTLMPLTGVAAAVAVWWIASAVYANPVLFPSPADSLIRALELFPSDDVEIVISEVEKERGGISYTSDTIRHFLPIYGIDGKINFIIGDDLLSNLDKWYDYDFLKDHVRFLCFVRDGKSKHPVDADVVFFNNDRVISSSTDVRSGDLDMLSGRVRKYVEDNGLYRA